MATETERDMAARVLATNVEVFAVVETFFIAIAGGQEAQYPLACGNRYAGDLHIGLRQAAPGDDRRPEAETLLDGIRDQRRIGDDGVPRRLLLEQREDCVGRHVGRRLVAGKQQTEYDVIDVLDLDIGIVTAHRQHIARQIVLRRFDALLNEVEAIIPVVGDMTGRDELLLDARLAERQHQPAVGPGLDLLHILLGDTEQFEEHERGQFIDHLRYEVGTLVRFEAVHRIVDELPDVGFELLVAPR